LGYLRARGLVVWDESADVGARAALAGRARGEEGRHDEAEGQEQEIGDAHGVEVSC
jgi:hypothetical protein